MSGEWERERERERARVQLRHDILTGTVRSRAATHHTDRTTTEGPF